MTELTPQEKAEELVETFLNYTHGYIGSSMLGNYEYKGVAESRACDAAMCVTSEVINEIDDNYDTLHASNRKEYWRNVHLSILMMKTMYENPPQKQ